MKKLISIILLLLFSLQGFACSGRKGDNSLSVYVPDGVGLLSSAALFCGEVGLEGYDLDVEIVKGTAIAPLLKASTPDIAIAPVNICIQMQETYTYIGTVVHSANAIITKNSGISSVSDLVGQTIYAFQANGTPGLTLKAAIKESGADFYEFNDENRVPKNDKINIDYLSDAAQVRNALSFGIGGKESALFEHGLLAEPLVTSLLGANAGFKRIALFDNWHYPQAGIIIKTSLLDADLSLKERLISALKLSADYMLSHPEKTADLALETLLSNELPSKQILTDFIKAQTTNPIAGFTFGKEATDSLKQYYDKIVALPNGITAFGGVTYP